MKPNAISIIPAIMIVLIASVPAHGQGYSIRWSSFPDGYALSTSGNRVAISSAGEPFVGRTQSPPLVLQSGFLAYLGRLSGPVSVTEKQELPLIYSLSQNYPNPFNPSTTVRYELPSTSHVRLAVYTILGQEVVTLVDDVQDAGYKSVVWQAQNVASGVYFYRIVATSAITTFTEVRKMLVMK